MRFYNEKTKELKDAKIVEALQQAAIDYENGEIAEVRDLLADIVRNIDEFESGLANDYHSTKTQNKNKHTRKVTPKK